MHFFFSFFVLFIHINVLSTLIYLKGTFLMFLLIFLAQIEPLGEGFLSMCRSDEDFRPFMERVIGTEVCMSVQQQRKNKFTRGRQLASLT